MPKWLILLVFAASAFLSWGELRAEPTGEGLRRAITEFQRSNYNQSAQILEGLTKQEPRNALLWFNLGNAYFSLNRHKEAISAYLRVEKLGSPLTPAALIYAAKSALAEGQSAYAGRLLNATEPKSLPKNLRMEFERTRTEIALALFSSGKSGYEKSSYSEALRDFETSFETKATAEASFMVGMTLLKLNRSHEARAAMERALELNPERNLSRQIENALDSSEADAREKPSSMLMELAGGYDSNPFGLTGKLSAASPSTTLFLSVDGNAGAASLHYSGSWKEFWAYQDTRTIYQRLNLQGALDLGSWQLSAGPAGSLTLLGISPFLAQPELETSLEGPLFGGRTKLLYQLIKNIPLDSTYSYLNGVTQSVSLRYAPTLSGSFSFALSVGAKYEVTAEPLDSENTPLSNFSFGPKLELGWSGTGGSGLRGEFYGLYRNFTPSLPSERNDMQWASLLEWSQRFTQDSDLFFQGLLLQNVSTFESTATADLNYTQWSFQAGARWRLQ